MTSFAGTPAPPYYAVIFTSQRTDADDMPYHVMAERMLELAKQQPGYLGVESVRDANGVGITVSYWQDLESIRNWREASEHRVAQAAGKEKWYECYQARICRVERDYGHLDSSME
jgi:heme-degrading monooxygenase HmoA